MQDVKELYILGEPIETDIGKIHFVKVRDYNLFMRYVPYLQIEKYELLNFIAKNYSRDIANEIKDIPFIDIIKELKDVFELYNMFEELFLFLFKDNVFDKIKTDEEFNKYKSLIRRMNNVPQEEKNPNPEIQYFINLQKQYNKQKAGGGLTFEAIYTSVYVKVGNPKDMTIYEMYALFSRIGQFKNYDTSTLYSTISSDVKVDLWYKHIDLFNEKKKTTLEEFSKTATQYTN